MADTFNGRLLDLLAETAEDLVARLDADASSISRVIGDVLILVAECAPEGRTLQMGQGYLVPDYPLTQNVLTTGTPVALTVADTEVDAGEARVLAELGFGSLLMLPLELAGTRWGLVEVYRVEPRAFGAADLQEAVELLTRTSAKAS